MALRVVTMAELRLEVLFQPDRSGETVSEVCRRHGISRSRRSPTVPTVSRAVPTF